MIKRPQKWFRRLMLRAPIWLYRTGLGWLLGNRFLLLNHIGRKSRLTRQTVLEVVRHDKETNMYIVASGWGEQSDWIQNIHHTPHVLIIIGRRRFEAIATPLDSERAQQEAYRYALDHPHIFRNLAKRLIDQPLNGTDEDYRVFAEKIPFVAFNPR
ncbi:MAG: nitroreductase family deazaflavin-dependent oxidoreductase [Chloroflexota bacterium]